MDSANKDAFIVLNDDCWNDMDLVDYLINYRPEEPEPCMSDDEREWLEDLNTSRWPI